MDFLLKINYYKILLKHPVAYILKYEAPKNTSTPCTSCPGTAEPTSHPTSPAQGVSQVSLPFLSMAGLFHQLHLELYSRSMQFKTSVAPVNG